ncbi:MAG: DUF362 domain-containing protein [Victivallales bacterium]
MANVYFASTAFKRIEAEATLPAKFRRMLAKSLPVDRFKNRKICIKMHLGGNLGYTTIHPFFIRQLVEHIKKGRPKSVFICDGNADNCEWRGYTEKSLGAPIVGLFRKKHPPLRTLKIGYGKLDEAKVSKEVLDADMMIVLSHIKGHGDCGFGGACKNIAMGVVPGETRRKIHGLEGGINWDKSKCIRCGKCIKECKNHANKFTKEGNYEIFYHNCTYCWHCVMACPVKSLTRTGNTFQPFQEGLALVTKAVVDEMGAENIFYINVLMNITIFCDCWGLSTPSLVPDVGILASDDIAGIETATLDLIKAKDFLKSGLPAGRRLLSGKHLFEKIHRKDPYLITGILEKKKLGSRKYKLFEIE